ncbi:MAG TPA: hypothetical protein VNZ63_06805 [Verrucomicrobiae bacterium]|nr:hypothetical protein [Verrucomicrobiae bacterium]
MSKSFSPFFDPNDSAFHLNLVPRILEVERLSDLDLRGQGDQRAVIARGDCRRVFLGEQCFTGNGPDNEAHAFE